MPKGVYIRGENSKHVNCYVGKHESLADIFCKRVDKVNGPIHPVHGKCWIWVGSILKSGYGQFRGKKSHRVAYELYIGQIGGGLLILHKCDNTNCVRPSHLFEGTYQDNFDDMIAKDRQNFPGRRDCPPHGELNGRAVLTAKQVLAGRELFANGYTTRYIINTLNTKVSFSTWHKALTGKTWRSLNG